jgi:hypothetical protein
MIGGQRSAGGNPIHESATGPVVQQTANEALKLSRRYAPRSLTPARYTTSREVLKCRRHWVAPSTGEDESVHGADETGKNS